MFSASFPRQVVLFKELLSANRPRRAGGGGFLKKANLRVNRAFQPFRRARNRSLQAAKNRPGKPRGFPCFVTDDSIGARKLCRTPSRKQEVFDFSSRWNPGDLRLRAPAASPSPSEAAIYAAAPSSASGILDGMANFLAEPRSADPACGAVRWARPACFSPPLYRCAGLSASWVASAIWHFTTSPIEMTPASRLVAQDRQMADPAVGHPPHQDRPPSRRARRRPPRWS